MKNLSKVLTVFLCLSWALFPGLSDAGETVKVVSFSGEVTILHADGGKEAECREGMILKEGDGIITGQGSFAMLSFGEGYNSLVKVKPGSRLVVIITGDDKIELVDGILFTLIEKSGGKTTFRVRTPGAICGARGTGWKTEVSGETTTISVFDDSVEVVLTGNGGKAGTGTGFIVEEGYRVVVTGSAKAAGPEKLTREETDAMWDEFSGFIEGVSRQAAMDLRDKTNRREDRIESMQERREKTRDAAEEKKEDTSEKRSRAKSISRY